MDENCRFWENWFLLSLAFFAAAVVGFCVGVFVILVS